MERYPNDFLKLRNGPSPRGQGDKRVLDGVDSPFLTKRRPGSVTRKKDDFSENRQESGAPYLFLNYLLADGTVRQAVAGPEFAIAYTVTWSQVYSAGPSAPVVVLARSPFIGDGYVLSLLSDQADRSTLADVNHWPVLTRAMAPGAQFLPTEDGKAHKSTSFINDMRLAGLGTPGHNFALTPTGWGGDAKRYRFAVSATFYTDGTSQETRDNTRAPVLFLGDTETQTLVQVGYPSYPGRTHPGFTPYVIGLGKLVALQSVTEPADLTLAQIPPYLTKSSDHGATWTTSTASFLAPYLRSIPASGSEPRAHYDNVQLGGLTIGNFIAYLGDNFSLLVIPNGFVDMGGEGGTARFAAMAFLGRDGGGYTRVSWPADDWYVGANGSSLGSRVLLGAERQDARSGQYAFGLGCLYLPVFQAGVYRLMVTRNFGVTWELSAPLPNEVLGPNGVVCGAIVRPFIQDGAKGRVVFPAPDFAADRVNFLTADGTFTEFKKLGGLKSKNDAVFPESTGFYGYALTNFGAERPTIFPAFPGEFEKPWN